MWNTPSAIPLAIIPIFEGLALVLVYPVFVSSTVRFYKRNQDETFRLQD